MLAVTVDSQYDDVSIECVRCHINTCMRLLATDIKLSKQL